MTRRLAAAGVIGLVSALTLTACGSGSGAASGAAKKPHLKISGAYMPAPPTSAMAAGFLTVTNKGGPDRLTSVTSDAAADVTMHSTEGGTMEERTSFAVPAGGRLDFARGANHLMFDKLTRAPKRGDKVAVELHFKKSGTVTVELPVKAATYNPTTQ
ncbi:copper chaperone PCu(A)C [Streptomyces sp. NPDC002004]